MSLCDYSKPAPASCGYGDKFLALRPGLRLGMATVPMQPWETPYELAKALKQGTIFPGLDLPLFVTGGGTSA